MKKIVYYLDQIFPDSNDLGQLSDEYASSYAYSVWLGLSQPLLNLPRVIVLAVWNSLFIVGLGILTGVMTLLKQAIISPVVDTAVVVRMGFAGRLTRTDDPQWLDAYKRYNGKDYEN
jgi:hypothetical protein